MWKNNVPATIQPVFKKVIKNPKKWWIYTYGVRPVIWRESANYYKKGKQASHNKIGTVNFWYFFSPGHASQSMSHKVSKKTRKHAVHCNSVKKHLNDFYFLGGTIEKP